MKGGLAGRATGGARTAAAPSGRVLADRHAGTAALVGAAAIWGATFALSKPALDSFSAVQLTALRLVFGVPVLALVAARAPARPRAPLPVAAAFAATGLVGYFTFTNLGLERLDAATGALAQGVGPAVTAVLAAAVLRERPRRAAWGGVGLAVVGSAVMSTGAPHSTSPAGIAFVLLGVLSWSTYILLGRRFAGLLSPAQMSFTPAVLAAVALMPLAAWQGLGGASSAAWLLVAALGVGGAAGYPLWNYGVSRIPAARAGVFTNVSPAVAIVVAWLVLGEHLSVAQLAGGAVIVAGARLASRPA